MRSSAPPEASRPAAEARHLMAPLCAGYVAWRSKLAPSCAAPLAGLLVSFSMSCGREGEHTRHARSRRRRLSEPNLCYDYAKTEQEALIAPGNERHRAATRTKLACSLCILFASQYACRGAMFGNGGFEAPSGFVGPLTAIKRSRCLRRRSPCLTTRASWSTCTSPASGECQLRPA